MSRVRHFALRGTSTGCPCCEALGFEAPAHSGQNSRDFADWLVRAGYSHVVFGCGVSEAHARSRFGALFDAGLEPRFCRHEDDGRPDSWLVVERLPAKSQASAIIWIPRRGEITPAEQLRRFPESLRDTLFVQWPHPKLLAKWGWTWDSMTRAQEFMGNAFPYLNWRLPIGWDAFNPETDPDLELEARPEILRDERTESFAPEVSIIVPTYNNIAPLKATLRQALRSQGSFEVLVVDDGSDDGTKEFLTLFNDYRVVGLYLKRPRPRVMGGGGFRAGIARNAAAAMARGRILLFLDSDVLIPATFVNETISLHERYDLVQATRYQLKRTATESSPDYDSYTFSQTVPTSPAWESFQRQPRAWDEMPFKWKFASTFCLSIKRDDFRKLGAFRRSFHKYGFEDTDLGYRAALAGLKFHRSKTPVYHFRHAQNRSEYRHKLAVKRKLLKESAKVFFVNNPDPEVLRALPSYLKGDSVWRRLWT